LSQVSDEGTDQPALVDTRVLKKALVLCRDETLLHMLGNVAQRHPNAPVVALVELREAHIVCVEHQADAGQLQIFELRMIGEFSHCFIVEVNDFANVDSRILNSLVLAELPICCVKIAEVDPTQDLDFSRHGLRVVHCRRDELVEVYVFDIESLAHLRAAGPQELYHLTPVPQRVEFWLHSIRPRGDLTENQRCGKDLDENRVHRTARKPGPRLFGASSPSITTIRKG